MKLLIPLSYLNEACNLSTNVEEKMYKIALRRAQGDLKNDLGPEFYEQIETQYDQSGGSLTSDNSTLYEDYLKDYLAWLTAFYNLKFSQQASTPTGHREFNDDNSSILSDVKLYSLEKNMKEQANFYKNQMINFLKLEQSKDSTKYPLYTNCAKSEFSWGISSVGGNDTAYISVNKALLRNE